MKLRVAGAAGATASATAPPAIPAPAPAPAPAPPPPPPPPQTPPPPPPPLPPATALSLDPPEPDANSPSSCPASGSTAPRPRFTTRHRQHRILAVPRATKAWFRLSLAWLRRTHPPPKPALNNPNTHVHKHNNQTTSPAAAAAAATTPPRASTTPASSTSAFNSTCTAPGTASTASTISFSDSLDGAGMDSRYSNTSADSGVVPSPIYTSRRSTSKNVVYTREQPLFGGKPTGPFLDSDGRCDPTVAVPTVEQCMEVISVPPNSTLMHSGGVHSSGALKKVLEEKRAYLEGYTPLSNKHISSDFSKVYADVPRAWSSLSTALATMTSGVVYVLLPEGTGTDFPPGGHFAQNEWPYLSRNVTHVIRINEHNQDTQVIYTRPDQLMYERQPTPEPYYEPLEFGYPLTPCLCSRTDGLRPPEPAWDVRISADGRSFKAGPNFRFRYTSDERSRGWTPPAIMSSNTLRPK